ncbi:hypothetical protein [Litoribrevibacter albus]|uniref:Lipoprotein n=1 Tax=Litoribrevibacter albus TaxID=1473156 RepID=A0AA37W900_9GAMM|nr:hypothetical protein [Litoribrevibacter albus]GLQ32549.1 hypothetical protein GCM10007876_30280 [Litoribrevibacter albus]
MTKQFVYRTSIVLFSAILTACGGGGGGGSSDNTFKGTFYDSEVSGLRYVSPSFSGKTDSKGRFDYEPGETISFYIGDMLLGTTTARQAVTPIEIIDSVYQDVIEETTTDTTTPEDPDAEPQPEPEPETDQEREAREAKELAEFTERREKRRDRGTINMVRFLMSLDSDKNPDNGIQISNSVHSLFTQNNIATPYFHNTLIEFGKSDEVINILSQVQGVQSASNIETLTSAEEARFHFGTTLKKKLGKTDTDRDGVPDVIDQSPKKAEMYSDIDGDGTHDSSDAYPENQLESQDTDGDGTCSEEDGELEQALIDFETNNRPKCISDFYTINLTADTGYCPLDENGNPLDCTGKYRLCVDLDSTDDKSECIAGDGWGDRSDRFPTDKLDNIDSDNDLYGDNAEIQFWAERDPTVVDPHLNKNIGIDTDGDGYYDKSEKYPNNPNEHADEDKDGLCTAAEVAQAKADFKEGKAPKCVSDSFIIKKARLLECLALGSDHATSCAASICPRELDENGNIVIEDNKEKLDENCVGGFKICLDLDGDGVCIAGDGFGDNDDAFDKNPSEQIDADNDGYGANEDPNDNDPNVGLDSDKDGVFDHDDEFPSDANEHTDTDGDGFGDNGDAFPNYPYEWLDFDRDGVGDNTDYFILDPTEYLDSDNDGVGNNADLFPLHKDYSIDTDSDGMPDEWETLYGLKPLVSENAFADSDNDGITNLQEFINGTIPTLPDEGESKSPSDANTLHSWSYRDIYTGKNLFRAFATQDASLIEVMNLGETDANSSVIAHNGIAYTTQSGAMKATKVATQSEIWTGTNVSADPDALSLNEYSIWITNNSFSSVNINNGLRTPNFNLPNFPKDKETLKDFIIYQPDEESDTTKRYHLTKNKTINFHPAVFKTVSYKTAGSDDIVTARRNKSKLYQDHSYIYQVIRDELGGNGYLTNEIQLAIYNKENGQPLQKLTFDEDGQVVDDEPEDTEITLDTDFMGIAEAESNCGINLQKKDLILVQCYSSTDHKVYAVAHNRNYAVPGVERYTLISTIDLSDYPTDFLSMESISEDSHVLVLTNNYVLTIDTTNTKVSGELGLSAQLINNDPGFQGANGRIIPLQTNNNMSSAYIASFDNFTVFAVNGGITTIPESLEAIDEVGLIYTRDDSNEVHAYRLNESDNEIPNWWKRTFDLNIFNTTNDFTYSVPDGGDTPVVDNADIVDADGDNFSLIDEYQNHTDPTVANQNNDSAN